MKRTAFILLILFFSFSVNAQKETDTQQLGKALEYFSSQKFHEALIIFEKLDKEYKLNPRYMAFIGTCYYYEWDYPNAIRYLDKAIPELNQFAPHERSFYYWANAESHFNEKQYANAIPLYKEMLLLCYDNEKCDAYFKLGFCYMYGQEWDESEDNFKHSLSYYLQFRNTPDEQARITQIKNMLKGIDQQRKQVKQLK